jgi:hypothetical protein
MATSAPLLQMLLRMLKDSGWACILNGIAWRGTSAMRRVSCYARLKVDSESIFVSWSRGLENT